MLHNYATPGTYKIEIEKQSGYGDVEIRLGGASQYNRAVNPSVYVTDVDFSFDIITTNSHAFRNTGIVVLKLTPYMTTIAQNAFTACRGLTRVVIPEGIVSVNNEAFDECYNVKEVVFPTTLEYVGSTSFGSMLNLEDISTLENTSVTVINADAFISCGKIREAILPETLEQLGGVSRGVVFRDCSNLSHVVIKSKSLSAIGTGNFGECPKLTSAGPIGGDYSIEYA